MYFLADAVWRTPNGREAVFRYRLETSDWNTLTSCLTEDEYGLRGREVRNAIDIGGHIGGVAIGLAIDNPLARVLVVEPVPDNVELIRWAAVENGVAERVTIIEGAAGDGSEVEVWYGYRGTELAEHHAFIGNSSLAYDSGGEIEHEHTTYRSLTIADILHRTGPVDFAKIDTEGGEWAFLTKDAALLPYIVGEWHPVRGHTQADMYALLKPTHLVTFTGPEGGPGGFRAIRR